MKRIFLIIFLTNFAFCGFFDFDFCLYNCSDETNNYYNEEENQDKDKTLNDLKLSENEYNFQMSILSHFVGFTFLFFSVFISILIAKKN